MKFHFAVLTSLFALFLSPATAATVSISSTAPTVNGSDISNLGDGVDAGGDQGHMWSNRPHQGQSFTTGSNATGYEIYSVTMRNQSNTVTTAPTFNVLVGTLSGSTFTQTGSTETGVAPNYAPNDYITFTFDTPLTLSANTTYAFLWGSSGAGFVTENILDGSTYTGGTGISSGDDNVPDLSNVIDRGVDRIFHVDLAALAPVPEPSTALLGLLSTGLLLRRRR